MIRGTVMNSNVMHGENSEHLLTQSSSLFPRGLVFISLSLPFSFSLSTCSHSQKPNMFVYQPMRPRCDQVQISHEDRDHLLPHLHNFNRIQWDTLYRNQIILLNGWKHQYVNKM